jgi:hypothetical protein
MSGSVGSGLPELPGEFGEVIAKQERGGYHSPASGDLVPTPA